MPIAATAIMLFGGGAKKGQGSSSSSNGIPSISAKVWQPGVDALEEGEELFDIVRDSLGLVRTEFPHTTYCVTGTQANSATANSIGIFKISNISGK
ncbi:glutamate-rich WD repeat-containing protein 1 [Artemisia annua]|uniref:Glutamate-rich WD repeat-containing protein 1 n=1 Tax=Artemisia annua TaxID=35608 RepID=A0A2U1MQ00_ARTAN|nr:glutamate-rich WD repeat-containing protein 1 [Artemisia annua]